MHVLALALGTDGRHLLRIAAVVAQQAAIAPAARHMALNVLAVVTIVLGLISFALGMIVRNETSASAALHVTATVTGAIAIILGLYIQMVSATRTERIIVVTGMIAGFVGACLGQR